MAPSPASPSASPQPTQPSRTPASAASTKALDTSTTSPRDAAAAASSSFSSAFSSGAQVGQGHFTRRGSKTSSTVWDQQSSSTRPSSSRRVVTPVMTGIPTTRQTMPSSMPSSMPMSSDSPPEAPTRRSSNFSEYSFNEARDILNPRPDVDGSEPLEEPESSPLASLSLAFALLPALAGALFTNGNLVATDIILLGLAAVFLHWSVTQPWLWYRAAQEVRVREEAELDSAIDDDSDGDGLGVGDGDGDIEVSPTRRHTSTASRVSLEDVQEVTTDDDEDEHRTVTQPSAKQKGMKTKTKTKTTTRHATDRQKAAVRELYRYELLALLSCFACPFLSAYLLHAIRFQLSRPSEGLVSNYNLTIFLMIAELRVLSHLIKLVHARTIHLQRIVHQSPHAVPLRAQLDRLLDRLDRIEAISLKEHMHVEQGAAFESTKASMARDVRGAIQPDLDALNRAVRRYEKKAALLQSHTDSKLSDVHRKLDEALALAAQAAAGAGEEEDRGRGGGRRRRRSLLGWVFGAVRALLDLSLGTLWAILTLPFKPLLALFGRRNKQASPAPASATRSYRNGNMKTPLPGSRHLGERVPTRLMR